MIIISKYSMEGYKPGSGFSLPSTIFYAELYLPNASLSLSEEGAFLQQIMHWGNLIFNKNSILLLHWEGG
jgi:hypothetical protein